jgi:hypothetical protein
MPKREDRAVPASQDGIEMFGPSNLPSQRGTNALYQQIEEQVGRANQNAIATSVNRQISQTVDPTA